MTAPASLKIGDFVRKVGGRYGGPGQIVGETTELDSSGYKLWNVAMRVEGGTGRFVHVFPSNVLMPDPNGAKAAFANETMRTVARWLREDNARLRGKVAALELQLERTVAGSSFQERVQPWMMACFGPEISADRLERADRFIEEALELAQSCNYPRERVEALVDYVYRRPPGATAQEVGGVMVTLAAFCLAHGTDMHQAAEAELTRIWGKVEQIRAKQAAKPTGSALPIATPGGRS